MSEKRSPSPTTLTGKSEDRRGVRLSGRSFALAAAARLLAGATWHRRRLYAVRHASRDLPRAVRALPGLGFRGGNVTLPHKERALGLVDDVTPASRSASAR